MFNYIYNYIYIHIEIRYVHIYFNMMSECVRVGITRNKLFNICDLSIIWILGPMSICTLGPFDCYLTLCLSPVRYTFSDLAPWQGNPTFSHDKS